MQSMHSRVVRVIHNHINLFHWNFSSYKILFVLLWLSKCNHICYSCNWWLKNNWNHWGWELMFLYQLRTEDFKSGLVLSSLTFPLHTSTSTSQRSAGGIKNGDSKCSEKNRHLNIYSSTTTWNSICWGRQHDKIKSNRMSIECLLVRLFCQMKPQHTKFSNIKKMLTLPHPAEYAGEEASSLLTCSLSTFETN